MTAIPISSRTYPHPHRLDVGTDVFRQIVPTSFMKLILRPSMALAAYL